MTQTSIPSLRTPRTRRALVAGATVMLVTAGVPATNAQPTDTTTASSESSSEVDPEQLGEASSRGSSLDGVESVEDYANWTSSGAEMASSGDPELSAEGSSRLAVDWVIGAVVTFVIGAVIYAATSFF